MSLVAATIKTDIVVEDKDDFWAFLERKGVKRFSLFSVPNSKYLFIEFSSGGEEMKYLLRGLEDEFKSSIPNHYWYELDREWQDIGRSLFGDADFD